ncbi:mitochondrial cardiolipin hydrolase zuc [Lycorma delicatula]|uniref:mitochondrial cardiolipin hydrolase zuc n=1 Tax=Lycorma delicatula TaxID=130591 RepID=UPI003F51915A
MSLIETNSFPYLKLLGLGFGAVISTLAIKKRFEAEGKKDNDKVEINEVLFFTGDRAVCRKHINIRKPCHQNGCAYNFLSKMVKYIEGAKKTLDVCLYLLTCEDLCNSILSSFKRGVYIRVITDCDMSLSTGSKMNEFRKRGIEVRMRESSYIMHHKYVIIDKKILMNGSLNWTLQAICGNDDNLMITSQEQLVKQFVDNFDFLWSKFKHKKI